MAMISNGRYFFHTLSLPHEFILFLFKNDTKLPKGIDTIFVVGKILSLKRLTRLSMKKVKGEEERRGYSYSD